MPNNDRGEHRTLQDDRAELGVDRGLADDSPLVKGEGAPLAQDGVVETDAEPAATMPAFLGGAPVPAPLKVDSSDREPRGHGITAPSDRPIKD